MHGGLGAVGAMPKEAQRIVKGVRGEIQSRLAPKSMSPQAYRTSDLLRNTFADVTNAEDVRAAKGKPDDKAFAKKSDAENIAAISEYERTGKFTDDKTGFSDRYKESIALAHKWLQEAFGDDSVGFVENYVRHAFKFGSEADGDKAVELLTSPARRSLSANRSVLNQRVLRMPLDEALQTLQKAGIDAKPVETNPERLRQWAVNNAYRALRYKELGDSLKSEKLIKFVKTGSDAPDGYVPLSDRRFQIYFKSEPGLVKAGSYYAPEPVAKILDRSVSKGLSGSMIFRGLRMTNNAINQVNLGLSAFHATETALNSSVSDVALGLRQVAAGRPVEATRSIGRGLTFLGSPIGQYMRGNAFRKSVLAGDPVALRVLKEQLNPAGARLAVENRYKNTFLQQFKDSISKGELGKALATAVPGGMEFLSKPLMEKAIPRIKVGAFLDLATEIKAQMPNASPAELHKAYGKAWDSIDNRLGMLTYDNLFWNRAAVDIGQIGFRSLGWNHGTELELGGGVKDLLTKTIDMGKSVDARTGKVTYAPKVRLTDRAAYSVALPLMVATFGAVYQYLHTGEGPKELKDYFYPKNGRKDANGNDDRSVLKSYMTDVVNFVRDPKLTIENKMSPLAGIVTKATPFFGTNRNYFGDMVRNPDDPAAKQWEQTGKFILGSLPPISFSQIDFGKLAHGDISGAFDNTSVGESVEKNLAIGKAPGWVTKGKLQLAAEKALQDRLGERHRTPEQVEIDDLKGTARKELQEGKTDAVQKLIDRGAFANQKSLNTFLKKVTNTSFERIWISLPKATRQKLADSVK